VPPTELTANPRNWRKHPKAQQDALADVLDRVGWVQDVIVNQRTGLLVDGHARLELALRRGEASVPVVYVDLAPDEETLVLATLDPLSAMAEADQEALDSLLAEVVADGALARMLEELVDSPKEPKAGNTDPDDVPDVDEVAVYVQRGDIYQLGAHRLMCGDSTSAEDVALLMGGAKADLVFTDPPYGVAVVGGNHSLTPDERRARGGGEVANDNLDLASLTDFLRAAFKNMLDATNLGACWYVCAPHGPIGMAFSVALAEMDVWKHSLVWVKDSLVLGRMDYHYRHEPIYYGWTPGAAHHPVSDRKQNTVWEFPRPKRSSEHPTMKPVELVQRAIENSSAAGNVVIDMFSGSGSTLIACESKDRICYTMELDPKYAQVAITRWEQYTGEKAVKINAS
jgi:DNA modification methylase